MRKKAKIAIPLLVAVLAFSGCGSSSASSTDSGYGYSTSSVNSYAKMASNDSYDESSSADYSDEVSTLPLTDDEYQVDAGETLSDSEKVSEKSSKGTDKESETKRKLIRTKSVTVETKNLDKSLEKVNTAMDTFGAYVESSTLDAPSYDEGRRTYYMTIRVPEDKLDAFMNQMDSTGTVTNATENTKDVTLQYTDIEAHKKALKTEYERVMKLLEKAETMDQILALESKLSDLRYQIDSYESQLRVMDNQISYSTVSLTLREVEYEKEVDTSYSTRLSNAFKDGMHDMKQGLENFSIWFVQAFPSLVVLGAIIAIFVVIGKAIRKKTAVSRAKKREERAKVIANKRVPRGIKSDAKDRAFGGNTTESDSTKADDSK